jgi:hypothetical protein
MVRDDEMKRKLRDVFTIPDKDDFERNRYWYSLYFPKQTEREMLIEERDLKVIASVLAIISLEYEKVEFKTFTGKEFEEYFAEISEKQQETQNLIDAMIDYIWKGLLNEAVKEDIPLENVISDYNTMIETLIGYMIEFWEAVDDALFELNIFSSNDVYDLWEVSIISETERLQKKKMDYNPRLITPEDLKVDVEQYLMWADDFEEKVKEWWDWFDRFKNWLFEKWEKDKRRGYVE